MSPWTRASSPAMSCRSATGCSITPAVTLDTMMAGKPDLATLKTRIEDYKPAETSAEGGVVISSADGIVQVEGWTAPCTARSSPLRTVPRAWWKAWSRAVSASCCSTVPSPSAWRHLVTRSGKRAGIPVGEGFLGRVIDPLGEPIDGKGPVEAEGYNPIEKQAPGILERQSVDTPSSHRHPRHRLHVPHRPRPA